MNWTQDEKGKETERAGWPWRVMNSFDYFNGVERISRESLTPRYKYK